MYIAGGAALVAAALWAFQPLPEPDAPDAALTAPGTKGSEDEPPTPFPREAFAAQIWNPAPAPESQVQPTVAQAAPAPPTRLQLIGITHDQNDSGRTVLRAALYDPQTGKLYLVASGETIGGVTVTSLDKAGVDLQYAGGESRLVLRKGEPEGGLP